MHSQDHCTTSETRHTSTEAAEREGSYCQTSHYVGQHVIKWHEISLPARYGQIHVLVLVLYWITRTIQFILDFEALFTDEAIKILVCLAAGSITIYVSG